jgi:hypothetical protein
MKWTSLLLNTLVQRVSSRTRQAGIAVILAGLLPVALSAGWAQTDAPRFAVPFIENDYARALADAQKRNVPLFIDEWAPW